MSISTEAKIKACQYMIAHNKGMAQAVWHIGCDLELIYIGYDYHMERIQHYELMLNELLKVN